MILSRPRPISPLALPGALAGLLTLAGPLVAQLGSPAGPVPVERLLARRHALVARMGTGIAILKSATERSNEADGDYPQDGGLRQDNDFFYLTGLETAGSWLVLVARDSSLVSETLYLMPRDTVAERWTGPKLVPGPEATALTGIQDVRSTETVNSDFRSLLFADSSAARLGALYLKRNQPGFLNALPRDSTPAKVEDLRPLVAALRLVKDADELRRLRRAINISTDGHLAAWRISRPGVWERELEAEAEATFRREGAERLGYPSIVGSGFNGTTLHYDENRAQARAGELVVMDMGAEFGYYTADVTRTIPISGKFTPRQRAIYDLVLATQQAGIDSVRPGITVGRLNAIARSYMRDHSGDLCGPDTCDRYFIHGLSHWLGMDVHDVGDYRTPLAPGMVLTVEPGIYIQAESLGVRIEDDVLVTETGHEILSSGAPRKVEEIEKYLREKRSKR